MKKILNALFKEVIQEAETNPAFRARLEAALGLSEEGGVKPTTKLREVGSSQPKRPSNRRPPAVLDPVHLAKQGDDVLRTELSRLDIEQLRDIVADYGMDTTKLVTKWRDPDRIVERIVEVARSRAQKGSAFRDQGPADGSAGELPVAPGAKNDNPSSGS
ncbi:hypothetical protein [Microvirga arabica]|uniref:hypothetical protein n=1 Tax=Microvirga arabica TaxID=1128671 RepID=UPI00193AB5B6|nr:hypothetical protein [Microvirga arabica]MBM1169925.1 hypothetical protein [Microvirga arabica]